MAARALVSVLIVVPRLEDDEPLYVLVCSACGTLTDLDASKHFQQRQAYLHAEEAHDGDVDRQGWA